MAKKKVYISSTYKDLVAYRSAIQNMFTSKGLGEEYEWVGMEGYVAESKQAIDVCIADVKAADIYILILAKRYGSVVAGTAISYTETEYNEAFATAQTKPGYKIFVFYSADEVEQQDFNGLKHLENSNLLAFYNKVLSNHASFIYPFTTPDNLCKQILLTFFYNFKKLTNVTDYKDAMMLIDRNEQSYSFSKSVKCNTNSFCFSSAYENSPVDFLERLYDLEMGGTYNKCRIELSQFNTMEPQKFREAFIAQLSVQWKREMAGYGFDDADKFFLAVEITSEQIKSKFKMDCLQLVLTEFLPQYLSLSNKQTTGNRVFFIFYNYLSVPGADTGEQQFDDFVKQLRSNCPVNGAITLINPLNDIAKTDARNWLDAFVNTHSFTEDEVDEILKVPPENPFKTFKMKEVNRSIRDWLKANINTNN